MGACSRFGLEYWLPSSLYILFLFATFVALLPLILIYSYIWSKKKKEEEKNIDKRIIFQKERKHKEKPKPILSSKEVVALPPSHLFKNEAAAPLIFKKKTEISLWPHTGPLQLSSTQTFLPHWNRLPLRFTRCSSSQPLTPQTPDHSTNTPFSPIPAFSLRFHFPFSLAKSFPFPSAPKQTQTSHFQFLVP